ncbi:MAG: heat-inducible transcription repressor HrcA [Elusimicrobia bacterium RIFCSPLOWO2_01_FULL_64_13]|nr:MAG: heat-inducible transcription repressor HrcA [Elusimicrobia bacterium RIFCSPHIGHO2_01_FULL_64_10]OGR96019.1 MAG: heat-inducible transcription repressor HrcA [Elusimicrobia bacterium RIFCSPLOWO2_01_FULL_64_13]
MNPDEQEQRKRKVLHSVIHEYVRTGKPVGSHSIVTTAHLGLSSATIRNTLSQLEEEELITHPHTSAGRVPTDKGYRAYVDSLIELQKLAVREESRIRGEYETRIQEVEDLLSQTSRMLSSISHYTGFVMVPKIEKNLFSHLELVPIGNNRVLVAMVTDTGMTKHFVLNLGGEITRERLRTISRIINQNFEGRTLQEVQESITQRLEEAQREYREIISLAKDLGQEIRKISMSSIYLDGTSNILALPDLSSTGDIRDLFKLIEEKEMLSKILEDDFLAESDEAAAGAPDRKDQGKRRRKGQHPQVHVRIGSENPIKAMRNLSLVSSTYRLSDRTVGVLGILGPKRMEYPKMIALVDFISLTVNRILKEFEGK